MRDPCLEMARQLSGVMVQGGSWPHIPSRLRLQTFAFSTESQCSVSSWLFPRTVSFVKTWEYTETAEPHGTPSEKGLGNFRSAQGKLGGCLCASSVQTHLGNIVCWRGGEMTFLVKTWFFFRCLITSDASPAWNPELLAIERDESTFPPNSR